MPLIQTTLGNALAASVPTPAEAVAIETIGAAWSAYFATASVNGIPATPGTYEAGVAAFKGALVGMSLDGVAGAKFQSAVAAFWTAIAGLATTIWITAPIVLIPPVVPPPGVSGIGAALAGVFASNAGGSVPAATAWGNIAAVLHSSGGLGAIVPGSVPPAPPAPIPIL